MSRLATVSIALLSIVAAPGCSSLSRTFVPSHPDSFHTQGSTKLEAWAGAPGRVFSFPYRTDVVGTARAPYELAELAWDPRTGETDLEPITDAEWEAYLATACAGAQAKACRRYEIARRRHQAHGVLAAAADATCARAPRALGAGATSLAPIAAEIIVAGLKKAAAEEAKFYSATYSARSSAPLLTWSGLREVVTQRTSCLRFTRSSPDGEPYFELIVSLEIDPSAAAMRARPIFLHVSKTRSKVTALTREKGWGFAYPWMWVHGLYGLAAPGIYETDLSAKLRIEAVVTAQERRTLDTLGVVELPIGRLDVRALPITRQREELGKMISGYMPVPMIAVAPAATDPLTGVVTSAVAATQEIPANYAITVVERNDLGDVIGKAEGLVDDDEDEPKSKMGGR